jgi:PII-like signaling protein
MTTMTLLRVYTDKGAYLGDRKVSEVIAERARDARLGIKRSAYTQGRRSLDDDRSVVIEIVDEDARLRPFMTDLRDLTGVGLMTLETVEVVDLHTDAGAGE